MEALSIVVAIVGLFVTVATFIAVISIGWMEEEQPSDARGQEAFSEFDPLASEKNTAASGRHTRSDEQRAAS